MNFDLLQQVLAPKATLADLARELRSMYAADPLKAERAVGYLYGRVFRKAEDAYERRGSRGRQRW